LEKLNEGKDQFLTILSHDLRNPITGIRGFVELMIKQYDAISDYKKKVFLQEVFDSVEKLSLLLTNVLLWVRSESRGFKSHPKLVDLSRRIESTLSLYTLMAKSKDITLENKIPPGIMIYVDVNHFDTIIRNLISNSLKFTDKKGYIRFEASSDNKNVKLRVSDTGIGMTREKITKVMQIHENTSTSGTGKEQGTGLGLNLIQNFVSLMEGEFTIESVPGEGSTFTLVLPSPSEK
jgi:signal transduction histidine kinase